MKIEYKVDIGSGSECRVIKKTTKFGERTSAYDSEPNTVEVATVYIGTLADCNAYIILSEKGQIN